MESAIKDRIHFLNTGCSDCILLESDGHYALIDSGEDSDYPKNKPYLKYKGYEDIVIKYLKDHCSGEDGKVTLDFIVGTHAHSDHIGGFDTIIMDPDIKIKQAYLRKYIPENIFVMEKIFWDNTEVYDQMTGALEKTGTPVCYDFNGKSFTMGNFTITLSHGENKKRLVKYGENVNSVVTLVEKNGTKVLLTGDMNYKVGDEKRVADEVGKIDLLKLGHHGLYKSTSAYFLQKTMPDYAVVTNFIQGMIPTVKSRLGNISHTAVYSTIEQNGIIAELGDNGKITLAFNIM